MSNEKSYFKMVTDMLTERGKYSQGRVYLLWSVIAYYLTLGILTIAGISAKWEIELDKFKIILEALQYAITLFGGYVFGGKFISAYKSIKGKDDSTESKDNTEQ
jgi:hypothetical protein